MNWRQLWKINHIVFGLTLLGVAGIAHAQLDPTSELLLRPSGRAPAPEDLDNSLFKVRVPEGKSDAPDADGQAERSEPVGSATEESPVPATSSVKTERRKTGPKKDSAAKSASLPPSPPLPPPAPLGPATEQSAAASQETSPARKLRELVVGGTGEDLEEYQKQVDPDDPRTNILTVSFAPAFFYEDTDSNYSFRKYTANGPGFGLGINLWITPYFGLQGGYFSSVSASVNDGTSSSSPVDLETIDVGFRFRKHFGYSRRAAQLSWGLDFHRATDKISAASQSKVGHRAQGVGLALNVTIPANISYAHTLDVSVAPFLRQSELATAAKAGSGSAPSVNAVGAAYGGVYTLDKQNQIYWKGQYSFERDLFKGSASIQDPHTGLTPQGVSVSESLVIFYFGFKWGS